MEFRFELPDGYSYQDVLALMRVLIRKRKIGRWVRLLFRLAMVLFGGSMVLSALSWLDGGYVGETPLWVLVVWPLFMGTLLLALALLRIIWPRGEAGGGTFRTPAESLCV